jgi:hypothetical protein
MLAIVFPLRKDDESTLKLYTMQKGMQQKIPNWGFFEID